MGNSEFFYTIISDLKNKAMINVSKEEFRKNLNQAIKSGLSESYALASLTSITAKMMKMESK